MAPPSKNANIIRIKNSIDTIITRPYFNFYRFLH